ncbi:MAG: DUF1961 family protein [Lachnospiraceae bacterium]|jgi:hypothetical protein
MGKVLYENPLSKPDDVSDFILEGKARISFEDGALTMENALPSADGQKANYVYWCPAEFPSDVKITWEFRPLREPGLAMIFLAAKGRNGESIFDPKLAPRDGQYPQYHHGDINAFHISYFRRKEPDERAFHTCNLRKSYGFYLVCQGADPIPDASADSEWYKLTVTKKGNTVSFAVNDLTVFTFADDGKTYGPLLGGGCIGFRQLAPMKGQYRNLRAEEP